MNGTARWPRRRPPRVRSLPPVRAAPPPPAQEAPSPRRDTWKATPLLVPARRRDALDAAATVLVVLVALVLYLMWLLARWPPPGVPARIIYAGVGLATMYAIALFAISFGLYLVPRLLGLRSGSTPPGKA